MTNAYKLIHDYYGDKTAKRSGVPLINHIDEGIEILKSICADQDTIDAYCLHPMLQSDEDLKNNYALMERRFHSKVIILVMEYRKTANAYLSKRTINSLEDIELSPLIEVNQMLWADKKQNQKDFLEYHYGIHERSEILKQYFENWITKLGPLIHLACFRA